MNRIRDSVFIFQCGLVLGLFFADRLAAQEALARVEITEKGDIWVGQRIPVVLELLVPGYFSGTPSFDLPSVPDILLMPPSDRPVLGSEQIESTSYTTQRHELLIFARRAGDYEIPPLTIRLKYKRSPLDKEVVSQTVRSGPLHFTAKAPPGAEKLAGILSTSELQAIEKWQPQPGHTKAGDAFVRTITFSADDIPAMAFPPFPTPEIDGLGIYPKDPEVLDHEERGTLRGERRDTITYVCKRPGRFVIPAVQVTWWKLDTKELRTITFPARVLDVAPNPAVPLDRQDGESSPSPVWFMKAASVLGLVLLGLVVLFWKKRAFWARAFAPFRPRHLSPLNPKEEQLQSRRHFAIAPKDSAPPH
jgi:hypothetical protein